MKPPDASPATLNENAERGVKSDIEKSRERIMAERDKLLRQMEAIRNQLAGLQLAIDVIDERKPAA